MFFQIHIDVQKDNQCEDIREKKSIPLYRVIDHYSAKDKPHLEYFGNKPILRSIFITSDGAIACTNNWEITK